MNCDMCGKEIELFKTEVEGSMLSLCKECSRFGRVISAVKVEERIVNKKEKEVKLEKPEEEVMLTIVPDYWDRIKKRREQLGVKQEDLAKKINEKKSLIHKIETGHFEPSIGLTRKIEKFLHIKLIEREEVKVGKADKTEGDHFTIGDFIKVRKR